MSAPGKRYREAMSKVDRDREYTPSEAVRLLKDLPVAKFDETVEVSFRMGVDPRKADQMIRGTVSLPHGTGRSVRVAAFAQGDKAREAQEAGADVVGADDLVDQIVKGTIDFDAAVATPDVMSIVGKAGRILGPRGLMPNPKAGTVTMDVTKAVRETKAGKIEFRVDKAGNVQAAIGKVSFPLESLETNFNAFIDQIVRSKPASSKGVYVRSVTVSSTMGPGVKIDTNPYR
jgi:large subunit ribosomal protein L1